MALRWQTRIIFLLILTFFVVTLLIYREDVSEIPDRWHAPFLNPEPKSSLKSPKDIFVNRPEYRSEPHPIDDLIRSADLDLERLAQKQPSSLLAAGDEYREKRGRHPPPDFDKWFEFATSHDCLIPEAFFDRIYKDIEPFWGLSAIAIRNDARKLPKTIQIRDGKVQNPVSEWHFINAYIEMLREIEHLLPDVDLPINEMDESRVVVSWEDVNDLMERSAQTKHIQEPPTVASFSTFREDDFPNVEPGWIHEGPYWNLARNGCPPESPGKSAILDPDFSTPPEFPQTWPPHTYHGYVSNWTIAKDPCTHAHLRNTHGTFVEPISQSTTTRLLPIFSGSKLPFNNDILLPAAMYWHEEERFSMNHAKIPWSQKRDEAVWRGSASGGRNTEHNWTRFQRHRFISMLNGSQVDMAMNAKGPGNIPLPNQSLYQLESVAQGLLPDWLRSLSNAAFTWLVCFPGTEKFGCSYTGSWYRRGGTMPLHRMFRAKYLPDIDGNSFSGRYRAFLQSNSLPIKATIYDEWHDDRLVPWKHFVPMDNTFVDFWAVLEYFVGHDDLAEQIALEGAQWADMVLRKEDMLVYVYRLILEYARVSDDAREKMGWSATEMT